MSKLQDHIDQQHLHRAHIQKAAEQSAAIEKPAKATAKIKVEKPDTKTTLNNETSN